MADAPDKDSKTEEATEKRIHDALEKGQVPFSKEAGALASLVAMLAILGFVAAPAAVSLGGALSRFLDHPQEWRLETGADAAALLWQAFGLAALALFPAIALLALAGVLAALLQNPPRLIPDRIAPKLSHIALDKGFSRVFGLRGQVEFLKACFKLGAVGVVAFVFLGDSRFDVIAVMQKDAEAIPAVILQLAIKAVLLIVLLTAVLVVADLLWARASWARDLRMTQEVKDEHKDVDGDPVVKARIRSLQRDRARRRMMASVPRATMVIANPTHYAIALRYVKGESRAPMVLAKGRDLIALKIREIAELHAIPVIEDKRLARSLYNSVEIDRMIPPEFYKAVAEIILYLQGRKPRPSPRDDTDHDED